MIRTFIARQFRGWVRFAALFGFSLIAALGWVQIVPLSSAIAQSLPSSLNACIPTAQVDRTELLAKTQLQSKEYYLLNAFEQDEEQGTELVIAVANGRCEELLYNAGGDRLPLSQTVPQPVARQLTLQRYRPILERVGKAQLQQQVNQATAGGTLTWYDEEVWALQQLGITIPNNVQIQ